MTRHLVGVLFESIRFIPDPGKHQRESFPPASKVFNVRLADLFYTL